MLYLPAVLLAYLMGSFPSGVVVVRLIQGIDVRRIGSRRSGATNVLRAAGLLPALAVFFLDVLKGTAAVWIGKWLAGSVWVQERWQAVLSRPAGWPLPAEAFSPLYAGLLCGLAAIAGHNWPVYIRFQGGRGVATTLGTLLPLVPAVAGTAFLLGLTVVAVSRYVSLGSIIGAAFVPLGLLLQSLFFPFSLPLFLYSLLVAGIIIFQHRDNIARLLSGTERRLGRPSLPRPDRHGNG